MPKKGRHRVYTRIGHRLAKLGQQRELSKALGLSQQTVSKKLRGGCVIMLADLERLAKKFGKPFPWFFEGYGPKDFPSDRSKG